MRPLLSAGLALLAACADSATSLPGVQTARPAQGRAPDGGKSLVQVPQPRRPGQENFPDPRDFRRRAPVAVVRRWRAFEHRRWDRCARVAASLPEPALKTSARATAASRHSCATNPAVTSGHCVSGGANGGRSRHPSPAAMMTSWPSTARRRRRCSPRVGSVEATGAAEKSIPLSEKLERGGVTSAWVMADQIFVGFNRGEWGGGLRRIDRRTGKLTVVESRVWSWC